MSHHYTFNFFGTEIALHWELMDKSKQYYAIVLMLLLCYMPHLYNTSPTSNMVHIDRKEDWNENVDAVCWCNLQSMQICHFCISAFPCWNGTRCMHGLGILPILGYTTIWIMMMIIAGWEIGKKRKLEEGRNLIFFQFKKMQYRDSCSSQAL